MVVANPRVHTVCAFHMIDELYDLAADSREVNDLSQQEPQRVASMRAEWFRVAEQVDRLKGRSLAPVGDRVKELSFRKDTSSGSADRNRRGG